MFRVQKRSEEFRGSGLRVQNLLKRFGVSVSGLIHGIARCPFRYLMKNRETMREYAHLEVWVVSTVIMGLLSTMNLQAPTGEGMLDHPQFTSRSLSKQSVFFECRRTRQ